MDQGVTRFQGWRGAPPSAPYFHNVRAEMTFGLPAGGSVRGLSYLALGGFGTVKGELDGVLKRRAPFGTIDQPAGDVKLSAQSTLTLSGWALDTAKVASVDVQIDGKSVATLPVSASRPDVCAVYPMYAGCPDVGFSGEISLASAAPCQVLRVVATDSDGNSQLLGERLIAP